MGASPFYEEGKGRNVSDAFHNALTSARYQNGNGGYTGSLAEKDSYVTFWLPTNRTISEFMEAAGGEWDEDREEYVVPSWIPQGTADNYNDKWGPAIAVHLHNEDDIEVWAFVGWASD